jgi:hypothetical protein
MLSGVALIAIFARPTYFVVTRKIRSKWWVGTLFEGVLWIVMYATLGSGDGFHRPEIYALGFLCMALFSALVTVLYGWKTFFAVLIVSLQLVFTQVGIAVATREEGSSGSCPWPSRYDAFYKICEFH